MGCANANFSYSKLKMPHTYTLEQTQNIPKPIEEVFDFFSRAENLETLTPDTLSFKILTPLPIEMKVGTLIDYRIKISGIPVKWRTEITEWHRNVSFRDVQHWGPYKKWDHRHFFEKIPGGTRMKDLVEYQMPLGPLGWVVHWVRVRRQLKDIFEFRRSKIEQLFGVWKDGNALGPST